MPGLEFSALVLEPLAVRDKKKPTEAEIKDALSGLKCRCGTHISILKAVKRAAEMMG